mgnify:CR=1 FL=1
MAKILKRMVCIFCDNPVLLDFYQDKQDILFRFMEIFNSSTNSDTMHLRISERVNEIVSRVVKENTENIKENLQHEHIHSQDATRNIINERMRDLELCIESRNLKNQFIPSIKGALSEDNLYEVLMDEMSDDWEVIKTTTSGSKRGDIFLENDCVKIIIDLKDYSSNVPTNQVDKIKRDASMHNCHGILASINTNITKHRDYTFEVSSDKILAYVSKGDIVSKIKSWANLILSLEKMLNNSSNKLEMTKKDMEYISNACKKYDTSINNFKEFLQDNIKRSKNELNKMKVQKNNDILLFLKSKMS